MTLRDVLLDPEVFHEPMSFRPERWLSSSPDLQRHMRNYVPFGRGSRMCLGMKYVHLFPFLSFHFCNLEHIGHTSHKFLTAFSLALAELYITIACLFRRKEFALHDTTWERDVNIVRDCFIGDSSPESQGIRIKYA
jgi:hypothetical protein